MLDLVCLGNLTIDDVVLHDGSTRMACFGGDAVYAALSARLWSDAVALVAPVGRDYPLAHLARLEAAGFEAHGLPQRDVPTYRNWVIYEDDGRRTWVPRSETNDFYVLSPIPTDIPSKYLHARAFLILAMDLVAQENLVAGLSASARRAVLALDPKDDYIFGNESRLLKLISQVDIFLPSEIEVERLLGHRDFAAAARYFASLGCKIVAIKMGENGSLIYETRKDQITLIPAVRTHVVDTTGAGDSFSGGFLARYVQTGDCVQAGLCGAVSASFTIENFGANHLFEVTPVQAQERLNSFLASISGSITPQNSFYFPNSEEKDR
jgi:ribokinase